MLLELTSILLMLIGVWCGLNDEYFLMGILNTIVVINIWVNSIGKKDN